MNKFRFLTSGESHGQCLTAIIEGLPSGITIDENFINNELKRRQQGYGRGERMKIENDTVQITSGVRFGKTLGSPITLIIKNQDFESWKKVMSSSPEDITDEKTFSTYRPGHADYAGSVKYCQKDLRNILERSSARQTAIEVAIGAIAKLLLKELGIVGTSKVTQIGSACCCEDFKEEIDIMRGKGDTLGGKFVVLYKNLPVGLGSFVHWDRKIDGKLAQVIMSIPAVKVVEIGTNPLGYQGSNYHDEIFIKDGEIAHKTNNAGGIEGGMTNGEDLVITGVMKPIPTMKTPLKTVDSITLQETEAHFERSDVCAVEACAVVAEARVAWVLADEILIKYGSDSIDELKRNYYGSYPKE
ncbi:chorismate synthase [bacterium]|nr:chorismate synthase [bacterium]